MNISNDLRVRLVKPAFPRSAAYDAEWQFDTTMGPNILWLTEWGTEAVPLRPGMRVLDLGCGKAASSIFLGKRIRRQSGFLGRRPMDQTERGRTTWNGSKRPTWPSRVLPVHAEAHALPFAEGYFDVIVSFDAYHYFGTDDLYLGYILKFIKPGGHLCMVAPGLNEELLDGPPEALRPYWEWSFVASTRPVGGVGIGPRQALSR